MWHKYNYLFIEKIISFLFNPKNHHQCGDEWIEKSEENVNIMCFGFKKKYVYFEQ